jgi:agmatinase
MGFISRTVFQHNRYHLLCLWSFVHSPNCPHFFDMQLTFAALFSLVVLAASVSAHDDHDHEDQIPLDFVRFPFEPVYRTSKGEVTADAIFSGITTFAKLPWVQCLTRESHIPFDIAFIGAPFVST